MIMMIMMDINAITRIIHIYAACLPRPPTKLQNFVFRRTRSARSSPQAGGRRTADKAGSALKFESYEKRIEIIPYVSYV